LGTADVLALIFALQAAVGAEDELLLFADLVIEGIEADAGALEFKQPVADVTEGQFVFVVWMVADSADARADGFEALRSCFSRSSRKSLAKSLPSMPRVTTCRASPR
jgi:hypothetical protein